MKENIIDRRNFILSSLSLLSAPLALGLLTKSAVAQSLVGTALTSVCDRSPAILRAIELLKGAGTCGLLTEADLASITHLKLSHRHLDQFQENDFAGLTELKKLEFFSLFHKVNDLSEDRAFSRKVFAPLKGLEELIVEEDFGYLDQDAFAELESLKILNLQFSTMAEIPQSLLELPKLEVLKCDEGSFLPKDFERLKLAYGDRVKPVQ